MFTTLAGRVRCWRNDDSLRLLIAAKRDFRLVFLLVWLVLWVRLPLAIVVGAWRSIGGLESIRYFDLLWSIGWGVGIVAVTWTIVWALAGEEYLRVGPDGVELQRQIFGIVFRRRFTTVSELRNLRYVPAFWEGRRSRASMICYEDATGTVKFGAELEPFEALAAVDEMLKTYPFPKRDEALAYLDLRV